MNELRVCSKCGEEKALDHFYKRKDYGDGYRRECKECVLKRSKKYYDKHREEIIAKWNPTEEQKEQARKRAKEYVRNNPEKAREQRRSYYVSNKEHLKQKGREWAERNREKTRAINRKYANKNRKRLKEKNKKYRRENPDKYKVYKSTRHARERGASIVDLTTEEWADILSAYQGRCAYCGKEDDKLTQDHVIPISKGGNHTATNIVPACLSCNSRKHTKMPEEFGMPRMDCHPFVDNHTK